MASPANAISLCLCQFHCSGLHASISQLDLNFASVVCLSASPLSFVFVYLYFVFVYLYFVGESIEATSVVGLSASPPRAPVRHSDLGLKKYKSRENIERRFEFEMSFLAALFPGHI